MYVIFLQDIYVCVKSYKMSLQRILNFFFVNFRKILDPWTLRSKWDVVLSCRCTFIIRWVKSNSGIRGKIQTKFCSGFFFWKIEYWSYFWYYEDFFCKISIFKETMTSQRVRFLNFLFHKFQLNFKSVNFEVKVRCRGELSSHLYRPVLSGESSPLWLRYTMQEFSRH